MNIPPELSAKLALAITSGNTLSEFLNEVGLFFVSLDAIIPPKNTVCVGEATMFARNWNCSLDRYDDGIGAWGHNTTSLTEMGCSLPEGVLITTSGFNGTWKECHDLVGKWLAENQVQCRITRDGVVALCDVMDTGPSRATHNFIDLMYAPAHMLNTHGRAIVATEILVKGQPVEIKGWDFVNGVETYKSGVA